MTTPNKPNATPRPEPQRSTRLHPNCNLCNLKPGDFVHLTLARGDPINADFADISIAGITLDVDGMYLFAPWSGVSHLSWIPVKQADADPQQD